MAGLGSSLCRWARPFKKWLFRKDDFHVCWNNLTKFRSASSHDQLTTVRWRNEKPDRLHFLVSFRQRCIIVPGNNALLPKGREVAGRVVERRDFLLSEGGANRDRKMAGELQHQAAAQRARLQAACPRSCVSVVGLRWCCGRSGRQLAALFIICLMTCLNGEK